MADKTYEEYVFTLKLSGKEVDKILLALATLSYIEVFQLIDSIRKQAESQKKTVT